MPQHPQQPPVAMHPHPHAPTTLPVSAPLPGSWRTPGRAWTAEMDMALVRAFCQHSSPLPMGAPPTRNFWPAVVKSMLAATTVHVSLTHEDERELCDSSRHRLKRLRQYAAQIHLILNHSSNTFRWNAEDATVVPVRGERDDVPSWNLIRNVKLRNRVRDSTFAWYPLLARHIDEADLKHARSTSLFSTLDEPTSPPQQGRKRRSTGQSVASSVDSVDEPQTPSDAHDDPEPATKRPRRHSSAGSEVDPEEQPSKADKIAALGAKAQAKRTWTTERDTALVEEYMASRNLLMPTNDATSRPTSSVWRRIVRNVFGAWLEPAEEREAGDSARHRLKKLRGYAAQVHKLLSCKDKLFVWDDQESRLKVNTKEGHDVDATWGKIRNPQVRNRLIRAHYPWLRLLCVSDADLPSTFHATTLGPEYFATPAPTTQQPVRQQEARFLPYPSSSTPAVPTYNYRSTYGAPVYRSSPSYHLPAPAPRSPTGYGLSSTDPSQHTVLPSLQSSHSSSLSTLPRTSLTRSPPAPATDYPYARYRPTSSPRTALPPIRSPDLPERAPSPSDETAGSVTRSSRIILTDLQAGMFSSHDLGRRCLLLLPRLNTAQRELFESVRQFDLAPGQARGGEVDAMRARQAYALLDAWMTRTTA